MRRLLNGGGPSLLCLWVYRRQGHRREITSDRYAIRTRNLQDWNLTRYRCANRSKAKAHEDAAAVPIRILAQETPAELNRRRKSNRVGAWRWSHRWFTRVYQGRSE